MVQIKKIAAGIGAALTLGYGATAFAAIPAPGAVADAYLILSNFTILQGDGALGKSGIPLPVAVLGGNGNVVLDDIQTNADTLASLGGAPASQSTSVGLGVPFSIQSTIGAGFVANTTLPVGTLNPTTYSGSATSSFGNALIPAAQPGSICGAGNVGDCVPVHNQVNLAAAGTTGSAQANQNLITQFTVRVVQTQTFELSFDADGFLRAALGQDGSANASYSWTASVRQQGSATDILNWTPNGVTPPNFGGVTNNGLFVTEGTCVVAGTCTEFADAFAMTGNIGLLSAGDTTVDPTVGSFEAELTLAPGTYTFTISHNTNADADIAIPEPGTLALLGAGLLGIGARRRKTA